VELYLNFHFHTKDLGRLRYFIGIETAQFSKDFLSRWKYLTHLVKEMSVRI